MLKYTLACAVACVAMVSTTMGASMGDSMGGLTWRDWSSWSSCSCVGTTNQRSRTRTCASSMPGACSGSPTDTDTSSCNNDVCRTTPAPTQPPVTGPPSRKPGWSAWTKYTACPVCGFGIKTRSRKCDNPPPLNANSAQCEGESSQTGYCVPFTACRDGGWGPWTWTPCSKTCGGGDRSRTRQCNNPTPLGLPGEDRSCKGPSTESEKCNQQSCAVDGGWTPWTPSQCSVTCGSGTQTLTRTCTNPAPQYGGADCSGSKTRTQACTGSAAANCPIDGNWTPWTWGACSQTCNGGTRTRSRTCTNPAPAYGGALCVGNGQETQSCNTHSCGPSPALCKRCRFDEDNVGYMADDNDEIIYYQCEKTITGYTIVRRKCGDGSRWDNAKWACVNLPCSGGYYQKDPANCAGYIQCDNGKGVKKCCAPGLFWNDKIGQRGCDWQWNIAKTCSQTCTELPSFWRDWGYWGTCSAHCGPGKKYRYRSCSGSYCAGNSKQEAACNGLCVGSCVEGKQYVDSSNCAGFKRCVHGVLKAECCGTGTYFTGGTCKKNYGQCSASCNRAGDCLVNLACDGSARNQVKNSCSRCPLSNTGVTARGSSCFFDTNTNLKFNCFNNRFNGQNVKNFAVCTQFKTTQSVWGGGGRQSILHNGDCQESPSFEIYIIRKQVGQWNKEWHVVATVNGHTVGSMKVTAYSWNKVCLRLGGNKATMTSGISTKTIAMTAPLGSTKCPLTVGKSGGGNYFKGQIKQLTVNQG